MVQDYPLNPSTGAGMCCRRPVELLLAPALTLGSVLLSILCICTHTWMDGYLNIGTHFVELSPWYICASPCPGGNCPNSWVRGEPASHKTQPHTNLDCFWMDNWTGTSFEDFTTAQQLEYWYLAASVVAIGLTLVTCIDTRGRVCSPYCGKAAAALLAISVLLSVATITVFIINLQPGLSQLADGRLIHVSYSWIFYLQCISCVLCSASLLCVLIHWWRTRSGGYYGDEFESDRMTIVSLNTDDMDDHWSEMGEHL